MANTIPSWTLGDRMAKARRAAGLSNADMAERLLRDRSTITNYEQDHTHPTGRVIRAWAKITGVSVEWLMTGTGTEAESDDDGSPRIHGMYSLAGVG